MRMGGQIRVVSWIFLIDSLGEGVEPDRIVLAAGERWRREMARRAVREVFVGFIGDVVDAAAAAEGVDRGQRGPGIDGAGRVVGGDGDDRARAGGDGGFDCREIGLVILIRGGDDGAAAGDVDGHLVIEIEGRENDHFVAGIGDGQDGVEEAHVGAGGDDDAAIGFDLDGVFGGELGAEGVEKRVDAGSHAVAVHAGIISDGPPHRFGDDKGRAVVNDALAEGDGARVTFDHLADDRDHRRLDAEHAVGDGRGHFSSGSTRRHRGHGEEKKVEPQRAQRRA